MGEFNIKPSQDDLDQRQHAQRPTKAKTTGSDSGATSGVWLVVVLLAVGSAAGGWYLWSIIDTLNQRLDASVQSLNQAEKALVDIRRSVSTRSDFQAQSEGTMTADIELLDSEVRKLWDLANKRNKVNIAKLDKKVAKVEQQLASLGKSVSGADADLKTLSGDQAQLNKTLTEVRESTITLRKVVTQHQSKLNQAEEMASNTGSLDDRITDLELAMKAINSHRLDTNTKLQEITKDIWDLEAAVAKPQ